MSDCQKAFKKIKQSLANPPVLMPPVTGRPLFLYMTVLDESMGCHDDSGKKEQAIYYLSKKFTACEMNYSMLERTCCALVWASHRLRQYMLSHTTWLISKMDLVKYIFEKLALTGRIVRWQVLLSEFDIVYVTQKAIKGSALADYLAQQPLQDYRPMHPEFPDEDIMALFEEKRTHEDIYKWIVCFDGASNALGHGVGAVLVSPDDQCIPFTARLDFDCTNNMAEHEACTLGIQAAIDFDINLLKVYGDLALLAEFFDDISFHHIPQEENQMADALATLASMFQLAPHGDLQYIEFRSRGKPTHCCAIEEERDRKSWYFDIKQYVENKEYPPGISDNDKRTLKRLATGFFVSGTVLYKRNHDMTLLRCVDAKEANYMIEEVHEGSFRTHANGHAMAKKILRAGYYWLTMESDCCTHVRKCHKCQAFVDNVNVPPHPLNVMSAPWTFSMWGIDVIGAIEPKASNDHHFILVAIDYFTKWVEATSYTNFTRSVVVRFIKRELICRYGLPRKIITDNGTNLNNKMMQEMCEDFKIQHHNSTPTGRR
ncbi:Gypsy retrotransposon integrase-like protein 1 [Glycine soja]